MGEGEAAGLSTLPGGGWRVLQQAFGGGDDSRRRLVWCKLQLVRRRAAEDLPVHPDQIPWGGSRLSSDVGLRLEAGLLGLQTCPSVTEGPGGEHAAHWPAPSTVPEPLVQTHARQGYRAKHTRFVSFLHPAVHLGRGINQ